MAAVAHRETLGVGRVLGESFRVLGRNLVPFVTIAVIIASPAYLFLYWAIWEQAFLASIEVWQLEISLTVAEVLLGFVTHAAVVYGTFQDLRQSRPRFADIVLNGLRSAVAVVLVAVASGVLVMLGFLLLVIPGLIAATMYWVAVPTAVVEQTNVSRSLARSAELTAGYRWPVFGLIVVFTVVQSVLERLVDSVIGFEEHFLLILALTWLFSASITAFGAVVSTVTYYRLRQVKEGIGIDEIAEVFD